MPVNHVPVLIGNNPDFIPHPTNVSIFEQCHVGKNHRVRLIRAELVDNAGKVINVTGAACAIKPEFHQLAVVLHQFVKRRNVVVVVCSGILVAWIVPIPRRHIDAKLQPIVPCGI